MKSEITVLGAGAWGTAVACLLAHNGHRVRLWCYEKEVCDSIAQRRENVHYLSGVVIPDTVVPLCHISDVLDGAQYVFEAVPVAFLRSVLECARPFYHKGQRWIILSKGIEQHSLKLPSTLIDDSMADTVQKIVCAGPSFAHGIAQKALTAVVLAAKDETVAQEIQRLLSNDFFRVHYSSDIIGVQLASALKNVVAIGMGILDGAGCHENTKAYFLTQGLADIATIVHMSGGKKETVYGLAGVGDVVLTSLSSSSRNMSIGRRLARGHTITEIQQECAILPEGINTVQSVYQLMREKKLSCPVFAGIYDMIFQGKTVMDMLYFLDASKS